MSECTGWEVEAADCIPTLCQEARGSWPCDKIPTDTSCIFTGCINLQGSPHLTPPTQHEADSHPSCPWP